MGKLGNKDFPASDCGHLLSIFTHCAPAIKNNTHRSTEPPPPHAVFCALRIFLRVLFRASFVGVEDGGVTVPIFHCASR